MWLLPTKANFGLSSILFLLLFYIYSNYRTNIEQNSRICLTFAINNDIQIRVNDTFFRPTGFTYCTTGKVYISFQLYSSSAMCISGRRSQSLYLDKEGVARGTGSRKNVRSTDHTNPGRRIFLYRLSCCFFRQSGRKESASVFRPTCLRFAATTGIL